MAVEGGRPRSEQSAIIPAPMETLTPIVAMIPEDPARPVRRTIAGQFDIEGFMRRHFEETARGPLPWDKGRKWLFSVCPFNEEHTDHSAVMLEHPSGALTFKCHHNSCRDNDWAALREMKEPRPLRVLKPEPDVPTEPAQAEQLLTRTAAHLARKEFPPRLWIVPDLITTGTAILAGKPKAGKSRWVAHTGLGIALGGTVMGTLSVERRGVLYLALEDGEELLKERLTEMLHGAPAPENFHYALASPPMVGDGVDMLRYWTSQHPDVQIVFVDTLQRVRNPTTGRNVYEEDYEAVKELGDFAREQRLAVVIIHHLRKNPSPDDPFDEINGSAGLQAVVDTLMVVRGVRGESDAVLHVTGRAIKETQARALKRDEELGTWRLLGDATEVGASAQRIEILEVLKETDTGLRPSEIAEVLKKEAGAVRRLLWSMVRDGDIPASDHGKYKCRPNEANYQGSPRIHSAADQNSGNGGNAVTFASAASQGAKNSVTDPPVTPGNAGNYQEQSVTGVTALLPTPGNAVFDTGVGERDDRYRVTAVTANITDGSEIPINGSSSDDVGSI